MLAVVLALEHHQLLIENKAVPLLKLWEGTKHFVQLHWPRSICLKRTLKKRGFIQRLHNGRQALGDSVGLELYGSVEHANVCTCHFKTTMAMCYFGFKK